MSDLIDGIYRLMMTDEHMPVNIGNPIETSIKDFALIINELCHNSAGIITRYADTLGDDLTPAAGYHACEDGPGLGTARGNPRRFEHDDRLYAPKTGLGRRAGISTAWECCASSVAPPKDSGSNTCPGYHPPYH